MEAKLKKVIHPVDASFIARTDNILTAETTLWHFHPEFEISLIVEGAGTRFVGDCIEETKNGELVLMGENLPHAIHRDVNYYDVNMHLKPTILLVQFHRDFLGTDIWDKTEFLSIRKMLENAKRGLKFTGEIAEKASFLMRRMQEQKGIKKILSLFYLLEELACCKDFVYMSSCSFVESYNENDDKINEVYHYTISNFKNDITLEKVASLVYLSQSAFCRYFKNKTNKTYNVFLTEVRIGHACRLLVQKKYNISEICYACGYRNLSNFHRHFKELTRVTPLEYQKQFQQFNMPGEEYAA